MQRNFFFLMTGEAENLSGTKSFWIYWGDNLSLERTLLWYILSHTEEQAVQPE